MAGLLEVPIVALSGGPGSGKSTALDVMVERFRKIDWRVITVPEIARMLIKGGISDISKIAETDRGLYLELEKTMLTEHLELLRSRRNLAFDFVVRGEKCLILCDRGGLDIAAYLEEDEYDRILKELGLSNSNLIALYNIVVHLVTAADGCKEFYRCGSSTDEERRENLQQARELDQRTLVAWVFHPKQAVIPSYENFDWKMNRLFEVICSLLDIAKN